MRVIRFFALSLLPALFAAAHPAAGGGRSRPASPPVANGTGWEMVRLDVDVTVLRDSARFEQQGTIVLRARNALNDGPTLVLARGAVAFVDASAPGARVTINDAKDTARIILSAPAAADDEVTVRYRARTLVARGGRGFAVVPSGAFASYGANWYPWPAADSGAVPDQAASGRVRLTVPAAWRTLSTGRLVDSTAVDGLRTETWESRREIARSFVTAAFQGQFQRVGATEVGVYLLPEHAGRSRELAAGVARAVEVLQRAYGPYPFETFAVAEMPADLPPPLSVGRSEPGFFTIHTHALDGGDGVKSHLAHELAHMWFPNLVDSRPPGDDMVDEAIADHGAALVLESQAGRDSARRWMREGAAQFSARGYFHLWRIGADQRLMEDYATFPSRTKGPWVYAMLRDRVGDSTFFATLQAITRERAGASISLQDLRDAFVRAAPGDAGLRRFFADWLDRPGAPVLDLAWERANPRAVRVRITQRTQPYALPVDLEIAGSAGRTLHRVELRDSVQTFTLRYAGTPRSVRLDPAHRLLLWDPAFGPVSGVTPAWTRERSLAWLADEIPWLMRGFGVTAASVAMVEGGRVTWTAGFGGGADEEVTAETRFPAGPLSQAVSAAAAVPLAQRSGISLDADVNTLPRARTVSNTAARTVTLHRILTHTDSLPGNAGYAALEQALRDATGRAWPDLAAETVLRPLGMTRSSFAPPPVSASVAPPPPYLRTATWPPRQATAAQGLWTTAPDLARFLAALMNASAGRPGAGIDTATARTLLATAADAGRGPFGPARSTAGWLVAEAGGRRVIYNLSYGPGSTALVIGFPDTGAGCVVMVNDGRTGPGFALQVAQRLGNVHGWPAVPR
ncbi:MAG TPA: serine hydrolase [Longimicrobium sp.]|nr:serine hydrolase [Longimicrobium sp.]